MRKLITIAIIAITLSSCNDKATVRYIYCNKCKVEHFVGFMTDNVAHTNERLIGNINSYPSCMTIQERFDNNRSINARYKRQSNVINKQLDTNINTNINTCNHECKCDCEDLYNQLKQQIKDDSN